MAVNFIGLAGRQGVLPLHYTEFILKRAYEKKDSSFAAFLDLFLHRLVSLFYRAWEKHQLQVQYERERAGTDRLAKGYTQYLLDLIGLGTPGLRERLPGIQDVALLRYAGLIAQRPHSASALESMLSDHFRVPVQVGQFQGRWFPLADDELPWLRGEGLHNKLGEGAIAGDAVWNPQARVRLRVGPLKWAHFRGFLPGGAALNKMAVLARFFIPQSMDFDIQLNLVAVDVPWCRLNEETALGLSTWLKTEEFRRDADDVVTNGSGRTVSR